MDTPPPPHALTLAEIAVQQLLSTPRGICAAVAFAPFLAYCRGLEPHVEKAILDLMKLYFQGHPATVRNALARILSTLPDA